MTKHHHYHSHDYDDKENHIHDYDDNENYDDDNNGNYDDYDYVVDTQFCSSQERDQREWELEVGEDYL